MTLPDELANRLNVLLPEAEREHFALSALADAILAQEQDSAECIAAVEEALADMEAGRTISLEESIARWEKQKADLLKKSCGTGGMNGTDEPEEPPPTYAVRVTERAQRDIDAATLHFADTASPAIAVTWREGFYERIASLSTFPRACPLVPEKFSAAKCGRCFIAAPKARRPAAFCFRLPAKKPIRRTRRR